MKTGSVPSRLHGLARPWARVGILLAMASAGFLTPGCRVVHETARLPMSAVSAAVPGSKSTQPDPALLQAELQRFSDQFINQTVGALGRYAESAGTTEARNQALVWKISVSSACVSIASGPNPAASLLDFLALATLTRTVLEEDWSKSPQAEAFRPWLETSRSLETNAWNLAARVLKPEQQQEIRDVIRQWWVSNAGARGGFFARPEEFTSLVRQSGQKDPRPESVFVLVGLDPTSGLDPAVREVTRTRLFAERALFTAQRMPFLLRWQIELLTGQLLQQQQLTNALASADRLSRAAESASQTAAALPGRLTAERQAVVDALEAQEGKLRDLSAEVGRTLAAGEKMSTSLNITVTNFDLLMKRFRVGEPPAAPRDTNAPPFNILDYARTAAQIAAMAGHLDALIKDANLTLDAPALDKRIADLNALCVRARGDAKSVLNHAFLLAAGLIALAFGGAMIYRRGGKSP